MSWVDRLLRRYRVVEDWTDLQDGRVRLRGVVEAVEPLEEPLGGDAAVAIDYRAWPPATTVGADGGNWSNSRAFQVSARQTVDFELVDPFGRRIEVRVDAGEDVGALHARLLQRYGVQLRAEVDLIEPGMTVEIEGVLRIHARSASPHRTDPKLGVLVAQRYWKGS